MGMRCVCGADSITTDTRPVRDGLRRRHLCTNGHKFSTLEIPTEDVEHLRAEAAALNAMRKTLALAVAA